MTFTENQVKGRPTIEYIISLEMAKYLAMMEKTGKAFEVRQYFIDSEKDDTHKVRTMYKECPVLGHHQ